MRLRDSLERRMVRIMCDGGWRVAEARKMLAFKRLAEKEFAGSLMHGSACNVLKSPAVVVREQFPIGPGFVFFATEWSMVLSCIGLKNESYEEALQAFRTLFPNAVDSKRKFHEMCPGAGAKGVEGVDGFESANARMRKTIGVNDIAIWTVASPLKKPKKIRKKNIVDNEKVYHRVFGEF